MSKVSFENKKGQFTIVNKLSYPEAVNERVYNAIASGVFEGFLPVYIRQARKEIRLECILNGLLPISQYFSGIVSKKMFLSFAHEIAMQVKNCEKNMVNATNLDLQLDRIFIDPQTKHVKCIFWPVVNNQLGAPPHMFLKQLPYRLKFNPHEDNSYIDAYNAFFNTLNPFSVNNFDKMVLSLLGNKPVSGYTTPSESLKGASEKTSPEASKNKVNIEYDPFANNAGHADIPKIEKEIKRDTNFSFCPFCGAKNKQDAKFCVQCGNKLKKDAPQPTVVERYTPPQPAVVERPAPPPPVIERYVPQPAVERAAPPAQVVERYTPQTPVARPVAQQPVYGDIADSETVVLGEDPDTTVLGYNEPSAPIYPKLLRLRTNESHSINKPVFRIGSEQSYCDLFIRDNTYVSRSHADIITRGNRYYIVDRNSTNRTYVDGRVIPPEKEVEIFAGTKLRLANDDFIFSLE